MWFSSVTHIRFPFDRPIGHKLPVLLAWGCQEAPSGLNATSFQVPSGPSCLSWPRPWSCLLYLLWFLFLPSGFTFRDNQWNREEEIPCILSHFPFSSLTLVSFSSISLISHLTIQQGRILCQPHPNSKSYPGYSLQSFGNLKLRVDQDPILTKLPLRTLGHIESETIWKPSQLTSPPLKFEVKMANQTPQTQQAL